MNVEPGTKRPSVARLTSGAGEPHFAFLALRAIWPKRPSTRLGSYVGVDAMASTRPVLGSSATAAPQLPSSAFRAARCASGRSVSTRLLPVTVVPFNRSSVLLTTVFRCEFDAVRYEFIERSSPARARDCVE